MTTTTDRAADSTTALIAALRAGGYTVETVTTGAVVVDGQHIDSGAWDTMAMSWDGTADGLEDIGWDMAAESMREGEATKPIDAVALAADRDKRGAWDWTDDSDHDPCDRYAVVQVAGGWALVYAGTEPAEAWLHDSHAAAAAHMQDAISE